MEKAKIINGLRQAIIDGEGEAAKKWANEALRAKMDPLLVIQEGIRKGLDIVGDAFHHGDCFLPDIVMAGEAAAASSSILERELGKAGIQTQSRGVFVVGTVLGDIHDIGKTLVATVFKAAGFSVIDLGVNVSTERFLQVVRKDKPDMLGLSAMLTTTVKEQKVIIDALKKEGLRSGVKVMVGGVAASQDWADEIGADGYGEDASEAVERARKLLGSY